MCVLTYIAVRFDSAWLFIKGLDLCFNFFSISEAVSGTYFGGATPNGVYLYGLHWDEIGLFTTCHHPRILPPYSAS